MDVFSPQRDLPFWILYAQYIFLTCNTGRSQYNGIHVSQELFVGWSFETIVQSVNRTIVSGQIAHNNSFILRPLWTWWVSITQNSLSCFKHSFEASRSFHLQLNGHFAGGSFARHCHARFNVWPNKVLFQTSTIQQLPTNFYLDQINNSGRRVLIRQQSFKSFVS